MIAGKSDRTLSRTRRTAGRNCSCKLEERDDASQGPGFKLLGLPPIARCKSLRAPRTPIWSDRTERDRAA